MVLCSAPISGCCGSTDACGAAARHAVQARQRAAVHSALPAAIRAAGRPDQHRDCAWAFYDRLHELQTVGEALPIKAAQRRQRGGTASSNALTGY